MSRNMGTIHVGEKIGFNRVAALWRKVGVGEPPQGYPSIVLGVFELTPMEGTLAHITLKSHLPAADVFVDNELAGRTPLATSLTVSPGAHKIELRRHVDCEVFESTRRDREEVGVTLTRVGAPLTRFGRKLARLQLTRYD